MGNPRGPTKLLPALRRLATQGRGDVSPDASALLDERLTSALRVFAALASFFVYRMDPSETAHRRPIALAVVGAFVAWSALQAILVGRRAWRVPLRLSPWVDLAWATLLVAVSDGTSSIFFPLYLFAILCASFNGGFRPGVNVVCASFVSFAAVGALTYHGGRPLELDRTLIRPLYLLILGYLIAYWGEHHIRLRARIALLRDVTALSNPRFGIDRMVERLLEALHRFYAADACVLVVRDEATGTAVMRGVPRAQATATPLPVEIPPALEHLAGAPLGDAALVYHGARRRRPGAVDVVAGAAPDDAPPAPRAAEAAALLGFGSFISVPFRHGPHGHGRMYVGAARRDAFGDADVEFLLHVADQVAPVLENVRLVDQLASQAAEEERRRIARDLHDSVVQPYVGLLLGMGAVEHALAASDVEGARRHLERLRKLGEDEVRELRSWVHHLRSSAESARGESPLRTAIVRYCSRFSEATGVRIDVDTGDLDAVGDRVAVEVFQLVSEALSNVRRHAEASRAGVRVRVHDGTLRVRVDNDGADAAPFSPRSLTDRATALGGTLEVHRADDAVAVEIDIPL